MLSSKMVPDVSDTWYTKQCMLKDQWDMDFRIIVIDLRKKFPNRNIRMEWLSNYGPIVKFSSTKIFESSDEVVCTHGSGAFYNEDLQDLGIKLHYDDKDYGFNRVKKRYHMISLPQIVTILSQFRVNQDVVPIIDEFFPDFYAE